MALQPFAEQKAEQKAGQKEKQLINYLFYKVYDRYINNTIYSFVLYSAEQIDGWKEIALNNNYIYAYHHNIPYANMEDALEAAREVVKKQLKKTDMKIVVYYAPESLKDKEELPDALAEELVETPAENQLVGNLLRRVEYHYSLVLQGYLIL